MLTDEQIEERKNGIGGSDVAAIFNESEFKNHNAISVYLEKIGEAEPRNFDGNEAVYWGNKLESIVAETYAERTGFSIFEPKGLRRHPEYHWMTANLDRIVLPGQGCAEGKVLECKTAGAYMANKWGEEYTDQIPINYLYQVAHYAIVTNASEVDIAVLIGGQNFKIFTYRKNKNFEEEIIEKEHDFWHNNVLKRVCPEPVNYDQASELFQNSDPEQIAIATSEVEDAAMELHNANLKIKDLFKIADDHKNTIVNYMKRAETLVSADGVKIATWKNQTTKRFNSAYFKEKCPQIYNQYMVENNSRVFRLMGAIND